MDAVTGCKVQSRLVVVSNGVENRMIWLGHSDFTLCGIGSVYDHSCVREICARAAFVR